MSGATRTYVVCEGNARIAGCYALASGVVPVTGAAGRFRRNVPDPIPVAILARLAVDKGWQGERDLPGVALGLVPSQKEPMTLMVKLAGVLEVPRIPGKKNP